VEDAVVDRRDLSMRIRDQAGGRRAPSRGMASSLRALSVAPVGVVVLVAASVFAELDSEPAVAAPAELAVTVALDEPVVDQAAIEEAGPVVRHASVPAAEVREPRLDRAEVRRAIDDAYAEWRSAFEAGDGRAMASYYTPDARLIAAEQQTVEGRGGIVEFLATERRRGMRPPSLKTNEVVTVGDIAYEIGTYGLVYDTAPGADDGAVEPVRTRSVSGRYFAVWRKQPTGDWLYHLGVWTPDADSDDEAATAMLR